MEGQGSFWWKLTFRDKTPERSESQQSDDTSSMPILIDGRVAILPSADVQWLRCRLDLWDSLGPQPTQP